MVEVIIKKNKCKHPIFVTIFIYFISFWKREKGKNIVHSFMQYIWKMLSTFFDCTIKSYVVVANFFCFSEFCQKF